MINAAVILAAGAGTRAGGPVPKQYQPLAGKPLLRHTIEVFRSHPGIEAIQVVISASDRGRYEALAAGLDLEPPAIGGATRQLSGHSGLEALAGRNPKNVLIHDAARPFASRSLISHILAALDRHEGAIPALPVTETLKRAPGGVVAGTIERAGLWTAQTPQGFRYALIRAAHARAAQAGHLHFTDDAAVAEWAGVEIFVVAGERTNLKLTSAEDVQLAQERMMRDQYQRCPDIRVGQGVDVHAFEPGDHLILCGIRIPHPARLKGHSDADAAMHALTDALLGSIGEADIGTHFPPTDPRWKNAESKIFLQHAVELVGKRGGFIANVDLTIICEAPRLAPHISAMRENLSGILGISPDRVALKATTSEGLGFTGRGQGLAAIATAVVRLP